jgi:methyl-accepting chemotaxis protein
MKVVHKLSLTLLLLVAGMAIMGVVGLLKLASLDEAVRSVAEDSLPGVRYSGAMRAEAIDFRNRETQFLIAKDDTEIASLQKTIDGNAAALQKYEDAYAQLVSAGEEKTLFEQYKAKKADFMAAHDSYMAQIRSGNHDGALAMFRGDLRKRFRDFLPVLDQLVQLNIRQAEANGRIAHDSYSAGRLVLMMVFGIVLAASVLLGWWLIRAINRPLAGMQQGLRDIAQTLDFTRRLDDSGKDEIAATAQSFNLLAQSVQQVLQESIRASGQLQTLAADLSRSSSSLSAGTEQQNDATGAMAAAIEQLSVSVSRISDSAEEAMRLSGISGDSAEAGSKVIETTVREIQAISTLIRQVGEMIQRLGQHSQEISSIVEVIREVAEQTNLLALNASIEAARAGEQGRGFAVVADEVRKLAERTSMATQDISEKIGTIQDASRGAVNSMEGAVERVAQSSTLAASAGDSIGTIRSSAHAVGAEVSHITEALREQRESSMLLANRVEQIAGMTGQNNEAARNNSSLAGQLSQVAESMQVQVARFRV